MSPRAEGNVKSGASSPTDGIAEAVAGGWGWLSVGLGFTVRGGVGAAVGVLTFLEATGDRYP